MGLWPEVVDPCERKQKARQNDKEFFLLKYFLLSNPFKILLKASNFLILFWSSKVD